MVKHYNAFGPYKLGKTIGQGEFGKVKLGIHSSTSLQVAVKLVYQGGVYVRRQKLIREIEILQQVEHKHIVKLYEVIETDSYIGMVLGYAEGGELFDYILSKRYLKDQEGKTIFLILGVSYLHSIGIVHRDLKLENLLLNSTRDLVITDFGFANRFDSQSNDLLSTSCGSPCYAAPELVINDTYVAEGADIWSCGVILYAMLAGYLPFDDDPENLQGENINQLYKYIMETKLTFPQQVSNLAKDLVSRILVTNPDKRAKMSEIQQHSWLKPYHSTFPTTREPFMVQERINPDKFGKGLEKDSKRFSLVGSSARVHVLAEHPHRKSSLDPRNAIGGDKRMSNMSVISARSNTPPIRSNTPPSTPPQKPPTPPHTPNRNSTVPNPILKPLPILKGDKRISIARKPSPGPSNLNPISRTPSPVKGITNPTEAFGIPRSSSPKLSSKLNPEVKRSPSPNLKANPSPLSTTEVIEPTSATTFASSPATQYDALDEYNSDKLHTAPPNLAHPDLKFEPVRMSEDIPRTKRDDYDRAKSMDQERPVQSQSRTPSSLKIEDEDISYLRYHSGPIDQRVLTSESPSSIVKAIKQTCLSMGLEIISSTSDPYKFKVLRNGSVKTGFMTNLIQSFFGRDRGYDGTDIDKSELPLPDQESIKVYISVKRIRNLRGLYTIDVKRVKGDVWQFKRVYEDFVEALEVRRVHG